MKKNLLCVIVLFIVLFSSGCTSVSNDKKDEYYAPLKDTYYFNSYEELETFLSPNQLMKEFTEDNLEFYGENFKNVVSKIVNGKLKYMIPILDEKECTLQKNESQPKIALFTCELYNEPSRVLTKICIAEADIVIVSIITMTNSNDKVFFNVFFIVYSPPFKSAKCRMQNERLKCRVQNAERRTKPLCHFVTSPLSGATRLTVSICFNIYTLF